MPKSQEGLTCRAFFDKKELCPLLKILGGKDGRTQKAKRGSNFWHYGADVPLF
ncbi:MAG: hypothetical protein NTU97_03350 [Candidatus Magasanikbacteria bacterium]|nr:hypothetical protein [Candidatus Magasanikbacteria bacterium]